MTAPTNLDERHAMRLSEINALKGILAEKDREISHLRTELGQALDQIDVLNRTLAHRTDALTVAVAELAAVRGVAK